MTRPPAIGGSDAEIGAALRARELDAGAERSRRGVRARSWRYVRVSSSASRPKRTPSCQLPARS